MYKTADLIRTCIRVGVCCILENPTTSMLRLAPPIRKLLSHSCCQHINADQCQFGAKWRKRIKFAAWHAGSTDRLNLLCSGHSGKCSRTGAYHIVLKGASPSGQLWTAIAQEYPRELCNTLADILIDTFSCKTFDKFCRFWS